MNDKIQYVYDTHSGDWEGLYINGELREEGHRLEPDDIMRALGVKFDFQGFDMHKAGFSRLPYLHHELRR